MQRFNFFFRQKVTEAELDAAFDACEQAFFQWALDNGVVGITAGADVAQNAGTPNLTVDVSGPASIYDQSGQRINWTGTQDVDCSVDENSNPTAVTTPGNEKYLTLFAKFVRSLSDARLDGEGNSVFFNRAESFVINVAQGAESAAPATPPILRADEILLADIKLVFGQTQILNADISTTRRQWAIKTTGISPGIGVGTVEEAIQLLATSSSLEYGGGPAWHDGTTNPATTVEAQLDKIVAELADETTYGNGGADKVGNDAISSFPANRAAGSVRDHLVALSDDIEENLKAIQTQHAFTLGPTERTVMNTGGRIRSIFGRTGDGGGTATAFDEYVAVGDDGSTGGGLIRNASVGPFEWTDRTPPGTPDGLRDVVYSYDLDLWVVVGEDNSAGGGYIATSPDGTTWTQRTATGFTTGGDELYAVDYDPDSGYFIAGGNKGTIIRSSDGITWAAASSPPGTLNEIFDIAINDQGDIIAVGEAGSDPVIIRSADGGNTWAIVDNPVASNNYLNVTWEPVARRFVAVGQSAGMKKSPTDDGSGTWVAVGRTPFSGVSPQGLRANGKGAIVTIDLNGTAAISFDLGDTWEVWCTNNNHSYSGGFNGLHFHCGRWFILITNSTQVLYSDPLRGRVQTRT